MRRHPHLDAGRVSLAGKVIGSVTGDPHAGGLRFTLRDVQGTVSVPVAYRGSAPDLFDKGRDVVVDGQLRSGVFVAVPDTLVTPKRLTSHPPAD